MLDRHALLFVPEGPPRALAVELHGSGLDVRRQRAMSGLCDLLLARGFAVLMPQGAIPFLMDIEPGFAWNIPGVPLPDDTHVDTAIDDLGWIEGRVRETRADLGLNDAPLFLAGYSGGARLASHLLVRSHWTAAGLVAGLRAVDGDHVPPPTIAFHGLDDPVNPYEGGAGVRWDMGVEQTAAHYPQIELHALAEAGHAWPGSTDPEHLQRFGPAASTDATTAIADFFERHLTGQEA